jgi:hypothetical protein
MAFCVFLRCQLMLVIRQPFDLANIKQSHMYKYILPAVCLFVLNGCSNITNSTNTKGDKATAASFFPVTSFIKGQIIVLDSLPVTPLQITTVRGKADSVWITKNELKKLLQPFLTPIIDETSLADFFTETKFKDETLNAITFTYDPSKVIPDSIPLRHWDVYIHPETGKVEKVYMVKNIEAQGQRFTQQLTWQTDKMVKITTLLNMKDGTQALLKEVVFIWNF